MINVDFSIGCTVSYLINVNILLLSLIITIVTMSVIIMLLNYCYNKQQPL